jgi:hypothetical protein
MKWASRKKGTLHKEVMVSVPWRAKSTPKTVDFVLPSSTLGERERSDVMVLTPSNKTLEEIANLRCQVKLEEPIPLLRTFSLVQADRP